MDKLRRSNRRTIKVDYRDALTPSYPDKKPINAFEKRIAQLNHQTFNSSSFSFVDDVLVYSLFSSKRRTNGYRAMIPDRAFKEEVPPITKEQGIAIHQIYLNCVGEQGKGLEGSIQVACETMFNALPDIFTRDRLPILRQYDLLFSEESPVQLDKVSFDGKTISAGLKAKIKIPASCPILSTSSSMSSNLIPATLSSISVIMSAPDQKGPLGPRLMLGPLCFANHDCQPNTQFKSVKNSHAYLLWSIVDIDQGEPITVKYTVDKSYFPERCGCKTCNPSQPPEAPRHPVVEENFIKEEAVPGKKRVRRGGRRWKAKRQQLDKERAEVQGNGDGDGDDC